MKDRNRQHRMLRTIMLSTFIALMAAFCMVQPAVTWAETDPASTDGWVYVGGDGANDEKDGLSKENAVKSWGAAVKKLEVLGNAGKGIRVCQTVQVSGTVSLPGYERGASVRRAEGFKGIMFRIPSGNSAAFDDIRVEGDKVNEEYVEANEAAIQVRGNGNLTIGSNTEFTGLRNMGNGYGGVIKLGQKRTGENHQAADGAILTVRGGLFRYNEAKFEGGVILATGKATIAIESGEFKNNKAHYASVVANYTEGADQKGNKNVISLHNALITNNTSIANNPSYPIVDEEQRNHGYHNNDLYNVIKNTGSQSAGGINVCHGSGATVYLFEDEEQGAAIFGNHGEKGDIGVWKIHKGSFTALAKK